MVYWNPHGRIRGQRGGCARHVPETGRGGRGALMLRRAALPAARPRADLKPPKPNAPAKEHQEYLRKGVCNVLLAYNLDTG